MRFILNINNIKKEAKYNDIDAIKSDIPDIKYIDWIVISLLKITVISAALRAIRDDEKTPRKV